MLENNSSAMLGCMRAGYTLKMTNKSISWLVIAAILLAVFLPSHYHLHHLYNHDAAGSVTGSHTQAHAHTIDLHVLTEQAGQSHHDEATSIAASPDGIVKKISSDLFPFILLVMAFHLLAALSKHNNSRLNYTSAGIKQRYPHFTPQLRAPPLF